MSFFYVRGFLLWIALGLLAFGLNSCEQSVSVSGHVEGLVAAKVKLAKLNLKNNKTLYVDSTVLEQGNFSFKLQKQEPYLHSLIFDDSLKINFFLEDQDVSLEAHYEEGLELTKINSGVEDQLFRSYTIDEIFERQIGMDIMLQHSDRVFSAFTAFYQFQLFNIHLDSMALILQNFSKEVQQSVYYESLSTLFETLKQVAIGQQAPLFEAPDANGIPKKLTDFRGKYVLLDFWASWCAPCRKENPHLVSLYAQTDRSDFEIIGLSVDHQKGKWLQAIEEDGLRWPNLSNVTGWDAISTQYGVKAIPQNFLLDPEGVIIDKNVSIAALQERFAKE